MNHFKNRIEKIETRLLIQENGISENDLLQETYKWKDKPFNSIPEIHKGLNVKRDIKPNYTLTDCIRFFENGLLSFESPEMLEVREETLKEMYENS